MAQGVSQSWDALYAALQGLFTAEDELVCAGEPGDFQPSLIVSMMGVRAPITQPTAGTNRSRDKRIDVDVSISSYVHGGGEAQQPANQAAWAAADAIEAYLRTGNNTTLGGACYNAFVDVENMTPITGWETPDGFQDPVPTGRIALIELVVRIWIRI